MQVPALTYSETLPLQAFRDQVSCERVALFLLGCARVLGLLLPLAVSVGEGGAHEVRVGAIIRALRVAAGTNLEASPEVCHVGRPSPAKGPVTLEGCR